MDADAEFVSELVADGFQRIDEAGRELGTDENERGPVACEPETARVVRHFASVAKVGASRGSGNRRAG
jgi:hypothetical protein